MPRASSTPRYHLRLVTWLCRVASLPGTAFGHASDEFTVRLAYVIFVGEQALVAAAETPDSLPLQNNFLKAHCGRVVEAIERMCTWLHGS